MLLSSINSSGVLRKFNELLPEGRAEFHKFRPKTQTDLPALHFYCAVEKDNGEKSLHLGHLEDGALFWFRKTEDQATIESFKERVLAGARGKEYHIDGMGIYGSGAGASQLLFEGRYYEVKP